MSFEISSLLFFLHLECFLYDLLIMILMCPLSKKKTSTWQSALSVAVVDEI